ncbi:MAG: hypothetical protein AAF709_21650 [Pseudomonadota bacterium]
MNAQAHGSIVAMEFKAAPGISFKAFVDDFDLAFQMVDSRTRSLSWERDDIAIVDRDYVRVALGWLPSEAKGKPWHLIIAVGSAPDEDLTRIEPASYEFLADRILDRTSEFLPATAVLRGEASQPVAAPLMDNLFDLLSAEDSAIHGDTDAPEDVIREGEEGNYADMVDSMLPPWARDANRSEDFADKVFDKADEMLIEKNPLFKLGQSECSDPMRLTIHTLALSMCLYVPPLGAALFTYTMLRDIVPVAAQAI